MTDAFVPEVRDEIHTALGAIRNALYLISMRCDDFHVLEYVKVAEEQARGISQCLKQPRANRKTA